MSATNNQSGPVRITFFPNFAAATKREEAIFFDDLATQIITTNAASKQELPWLKLATFGDLRSDGNSLRNNANVQTITGIEADYDGEIVSFDEARDRLLNVRVAALLYTSPSHTEAAPRWRVLCRFSKPMRPELHGIHLARLNGLLGGIVSTESWTLSQSYYFGGVDHNPDHRAEVLDGTPIDLMDELDAAAIGKPPTKANDNANERPVGSEGDSYVPVSDARLEAYRVTLLNNLRRQAVDGQKHVQLRNAALALGGIQDAAGFTDSEALQWLMDALPETVVDWRAAQQTARWGLAQGRKAPIQLQDRSHPGKGSHAASEPLQATSKADHGDTQDEPPHEAEPPATASHGKGEQAERPKQKDQHSTELPPEFRDEVPPECTDEALALQFSEDHAHQLRHVAAWGKWLEWDGARWRPDGTLATFDRARKICRRASSQCENIKVAARIASASTVAAVERLAKADRRHAATAEQWDVDPWLLNTPGGTVDLKTGKMRKHVPGDHLTKITAVAPGGECPMWHAFLATVTNSDARPAEPRVAATPLCWRWTRSAPWLGETSWRPW